jgi:hypothetical protein
MTQSMDEEIREVAGRLLEDDGEAMCKVFGSAGRTLAPHLAVLLSRASTTPNFQLFTAAHRVARHLEDLGA